MHVCICDLYNNALCSSDYAVSSYGIYNVSLIGTCMEGSVPGLLQGIPLRSSAGAEDKS
jgi:hypothetical protein